MRLEHPIFRGPLVPTLETFAMATPEGYRHWHAGRELPATLTAWKVQAGELGKTVDYGLVSDPLGFEDTPDAEVISAGTNTKGPDSVALGRHGNWFLWGFAGDPTQMTPSARQVFLNTLVWMDQFDGQLPQADLPKVRRPARESILDRIAFLEEYKSQPQVMSWLRAEFIPEVFAECEGEAARLLEWYVENLEQLHPTAVTVDEGERTFQTFRLVVDPLLLHLGVGNRSPELFAQIDWLLGEPRDAPGLLALQKTLSTEVPDGDLARVLIDRYLPPDAPREAAALRRWVEERRDRLYFSDVYGYRWFVAEEPLPERMRRRGFGAFPPAPPPPASRRFP